MASIDRPVSRVSPAEKFGRTTVYEGELLRHSVYNRVVHWAVAIFFILALLSGFALFTPWLFAWVAPLFGSGARARVLHPWFGLGFVIALIFQLRGWYAAMRWKESDSRWLRRIRAYITNTERAEADDVGKFNAGQKLWFWTMIYSGLVFLITGIPLWFPEVFGRTLMWICNFFHDIAGLVMLAGFIVHIYEGTLAISGTFRSMTRGTVTRQWGWTHHPAWYRELTGRDARQDREEARRG
jgi:formate dehydrogenase subunit gamma